MLKQNEKAPPSALDTTIDFKKEHPTFATRPASQLSDALHALELRACMQITIYLTNPESTKVRKQYHYCTANDITGRHKTGTYEAHGPRDSHSRLGSLAYLLA